MLNLVSILISFQIVNFFPSIVTSFINISNVFFIILFSILKYLKKIHKKMQPED